MVKPDLHLLVKQFISRFSQVNMSVQEQTLVRQIYLLLAKGKPVLHEQIALSLGITGDSVNKAIKKLPSMYIDFDNQGRVTEFGGFGLDPTQNRFKVLGTTLYAWCAWDALFIPPILDETVYVEANCPVTDDQIQMTVTPRGVLDVKPAKTVMTFAIPGMEAFPDPEKFSFMKTVFFFNSREAASKWVSENPGPVILSLDEGFELGRTMNRIRFKEVLSV